MENKEKMDIEKEFQHYLEIFKHDKELTILKFSSMIKNLAKP